MLQPVDKGESKVLSISDVLFATDVREATDM